VVCNTVLSTHGDACTLDKSAQKREMRWGGEQNNIQLQHLFSESITTTSRKPTLKHQQSSLQLLWCLESSAVDCTDAEWARVQPGV
jgi:hypothetical protein